jgi:ADP-ribose pyrophosphatase YjhB (NUDIX family)
MSDPRAYPERPFLAVSAAIIREGHVLVAQRTKVGSASVGLFTLPGGVVEAGETLHQAIVREVAEETGIVIEPVALAGHREFITRSADGRVERHFVILCFAARWIVGEGTPDPDELADLRWVRPAELAALRTTPGLAEIVAEAFARMEGA